MARTKNTSLKNKASASQPDQKRKDDEDESLPSPTKLRKMAQMDERIEKEVDCKDTVHEDTRILYETILYGTRTAPIDFQNIANNVGIDVETVYKRHFVLMGKITQRLSVEDAAKQAEKLAMKGCDEILDQTND